MSADTVPTVLAAIELNETEFSTFLTDFLGPVIAGHLPEAVHSTFKQLTGRDAFPNYKTFKLTSSETPAEAFFFSFIPEDEAGFDLQLETNFYQGNVSADAMGLIVTLYVINGMLWSNAMPERTQRYLHNAFYLLRDLAAEHPEVTEIYGAID